MEKRDVIIIGAGLLGCFAARELARYELSITVLEKREDVCTGLSRANTGIIYTGCDTKPGTLKTRLCVKANENFTKLCRELDVRFSRPGSLMLSFGPRGNEVLDKKLAQGQENGVKGLRLLDRDEVLSMEPNISPTVQGGLFAPGTGTVDPWELCIAAFENARDNGVDFRFNEELLRIERQGESFLLHTEREDYSCRAIVNCAGLNADAVREMLRTPLVRLYPSAADYLVLDTTANGFINHIVFHEPERKGKGLTLVPTVDGNLLIGPTEYDADSQEPWATTAEGLEKLRSLCAQIVPELDMSQTIRNFGSLRPNPYFVREENGVWVPEGRNISNFTVLEEDGLFSLVGIKTPGLSCASELGKYMAGKIRGFLGCDSENARFSPARRGIIKVSELPITDRAALAEKEPDYGHIVCRCRGVSRGEVIEAINRGAVTLDGVKRRTGAGMGRCQGGYCSQAIIELIARHSGQKIEAVRKDGPGTEMINGIF